MIRRREFIAGLGSAAAWPVVARAQQPNMPVVGILDFNGPRPHPLLMDELRAGLAEAGFIEGRNLSIEYRGATFFQQLQSMAADLVRREVAVIVAVGALGPPLVAKRATSTIPIVFYYGGNPVKDGLVVSLSRPGGNVTGMTGTNDELDGKRLDLLLKMVPNARKVGYLSGDKSLAYYERTTTAVLAAGRALGVKIMIVECRTDREYEAALAKMVEGGVDAMILSALPLPNLANVVSLAAFHKLPTIYPLLDLARAGGLMSYDSEGTGRYLGGYYIARILKGEKPADLPVEQPTKFKLVINLKTAKALGLTIPETLLATADEVIQ
jgi:putative ABC transport system substrate-binding protein